MKKMILTFSIVAIFLLNIFLVFSEGSFASSAGWSQDKSIIKNIPPEGGGKIAVSGNNIHVISYDFDVKKSVYKRSSDSGVSWDSNIWITSSYAVDIAADENNVHVVFRKTNSNGNSQICYKKSTNNGDDWGNEVCLTPDSFSSIAPQMAVNGNNIHIIWRDNRTGDYQIYYKRSIDNGETWGNDILLTDNLKSRNPHFVAYGNNIHFIWTISYSVFDSDIYYKRSLNNGETWSNDVKLTDTPSSESDYPRLAVYKDNIHVIWTDDRDSIIFPYLPDIYYKRSTDNGETWGSDTRLTYIGSEGGNIFHPRIAVNKDNIHIFWYAEISSNLDDDIYYKKSTDNGVNWDNKVCLVDTISWSYFPEVALNGNNIHLIWSDVREGSWDIYYKNNLNEKPVVDTFDFSEDYVYSGEEIMFYINGSDDNDYEYDLTPFIEYKHSADSTWDNSCLSEMIWDTTKWYWTSTFSPSGDLETGLYDFRVRFTDSDEVDSDWLDGAVQIDVRVHPEAVLSASSTNIIKGDSVSFDASGSVGDDLVFYFDFGDGAIINWQSDAVKSHLFSEVGTYIVQLKVRDSYGEESSLDSVEIIVDSSKSNDESNSGFDMILVFGIIIVLLIIATILLLIRKRNKG